MSYSITTKDGITVQNIPDDVAPDDPRLKERVARARAEREELSRLARQQPTGNPNAVSMPSKRPAGYSEPAGFVANLGQGLTFDAYDEIQGGLQGIGGAIGAGVQAIGQGRNPIEAAGRGYQQGYRQGADQTRAYADQYLNDRFLAANFARGLGAALPAFATLGQTLPASVGGTVTRTALNEAARRPFVSGMVYGAGGAGAQTVASGITPEERFDGGRIATNMAIGLGVGGGAGALIGHGAPAVARLSGFHGLTPEQRAARLLQAKVLKNETVVDPQTGRSRPMTMEDSRLQAQRIANSSTGKTAEPVFMAMGQQGGPAWRAARAAAQVEGPGQGISISAMNAARYGVDDEAAQILARASGQRVKDVRANAANTGYSGTQGSRQERIAQSVGKNMLPDDDNLPNNFEQARKMLEDGRSNMARQAYAYAYEQPPSSPEAARAMAMQMTDPRAAAHAADLLATTPQAKAGRAIAPLGPEETRVIAAMRETSDPQTLARLQAQLADIELSAAQLRQIANGQIPEQPITARAAAAYKRGISQVAMDLGPRTPLGSAAQSGVNNYRTALHEAYPALKQVDEAYENISGVIDSMDAGRKALAMRPGELDQTLATLSDDDFKAFLIGLADDFNYRLANNEANFVGKVITNRAFRDRLFSVLDRKQAIDFMTRLARETRIEAASRFVLNNKNSPTAPLTEDIRAFTVGEAEGNIINDLNSVVTDPKNFVVRQLAKWYARRQMPGLRNNEVNRAFAQMLYAPATPANIAKIQAIIDTLPENGAPPVLAQRLSAILARSTTSTIRATMQEPGVTITDWSEE